MCALRQQVLLALLGGLLASSLYAQPQTLLDSGPLPRPDDDPVHFEHLTNNDGLSQQSVYAIVQDRHGFMWFATQNGLNKYDGYSFTVYHHDPEDERSLQAGEIRALHEDTQGRLWVGTFRPGGGLSYLDPATETFTRFEHDPGVTPLQWTL